MRHVLIFFFILSAIAGGLPAVVADETSEAPAASLAGGVLPSAAGAALPSDAVRLWDRHVRRLLQANCLKCHGDRAKKGLDLRSLESLLAGGESGPAVLAGKPAESRLVTLVLPEADPHMPPGEKQLPAEEIHLLETFVRRLDPSAPRDLEPARDAAPEASQLPRGLDPSLVVDFYLARARAEAGVVARPLIDDSAYLRRLSLDLLGRPPVSEERATFLAETSSLKREALLDRLLESPEHARHLREVFDVVLLGRRGPKTSRERAQHRWHAWLEGAFLANRPWDDIVRALLVARPASKDEGGAAWYLHEGREKHQQMAEAVSPALLGIRVECAQCHDHPIAPEIEQRHYWGLVAFFSRTKNIATPFGPGVTESAIGGWSKYADLDGNNHEAFPVFFDGREVAGRRPPEGEKEKDEPALYRVTPGGAQGYAVPRRSRREALARFVVDSPYLGRALVNRVWALLFGRGLVHPVDRMDSAHRPSHPELLDWLAADFRASGHDLRRLIRALVRSGSYQLASDWPEEGAVPTDALYARALEKPLGAEALARSLVVVLSGRTQADGELAASYAELEAAMVRLFPALFAEVHEATLGQSLFLANHPLLPRLLEPREGNLTARLLAMTDPSERARHAVREVFGREAAAVEVERIVRYLREREGREADALAQVLWALLASAEFRFNH